MSVSSSSESDDDASPPTSRDERANSAPALSKDGDGEGDAVGLAPPAASTPTSRRSSKAELDKDALVRRVVELLDEEMEEEVKEVLKPYMGELAKVSGARPIFTACAHRSG